MFPEPVFPVPGFLFRKVITSAVTATVNTVLATSAIESGIASEPSNSKCTMTPTPAGTNSNDRLFSKAVVMLSSCCGLAFGNSFHCVPADTFVNVATVRLSARLCKNLSAARKAAEVDLKQYNRSTDSQTDDLHVRIETYAL